MSGGPGWLARRLTSFIASSRIFQVNNNNKSTSIIRFLSSSSSSSFVPQRFQDHSNNQDVAQVSEADSAIERMNTVGKNISRTEKINFLVNTLLDLKDSRESIYGTLDAWVAWEQHFPISAIKRVTHMLEKEQQWHRIVQVIKWMLSKGQGKTNGTYGQLIRALDMDHRADEAHQIWVKKVGSDLHSVPWQLCRQMIGIYYRNNMMEDVVKLFKGLEAFGRKPPDKTIVQRVADAYELLGLPEEKDRVLEKYNYLFTGSTEEKSTKSKKAFSKKKKKPDAAGEGEKASSSEGSSATAVNTKD